MDSFYWNGNNANHYYDHCYSQTHQEGDQHASQPETGQTSGGVAASGALWSHPVPEQSYQDFNVQAQIPYSPRPDWESFLRTPQPMTMEDIIYSQIHQQDAQPETGQTSAGGSASGPWWSQPTPDQLQPHQDSNFSVHQQDGQYSSQPETGQTSAGGPASGPWWSQPTPDQLQPYQDSNFPVQIQSSLGSDLGLEYLQPPQPMVLEDTIQNDAPLAPFDPQPAAPTNGLPPSKERFLAGLEAYARGAALKDCSSSIQFANCIRNDGSMTTYGQGLYKQLTDAEKILLEQAIIARQGTRDIKVPVKERFLAGLDNYARGAPLAHCSATLKFSIYVTDSGYLHPDGEYLRDRLPQGEQAQLDDALLSRRKFYSSKANRANKAPVEERFLAGLDKYAQGVPLINCSTTIDFGSYVTDTGSLRPRGVGLRKNLLPKDQDRLNAALIARHELHSNRANKAPVEERFLAGLDNYAQGVQLDSCSATLSFDIYVTDDGKLHRDGRGLYKRLSPQDQNRVNQALAVRRRMAAERIAGDLPYFIKALKPYSTGVDFHTCAKESGLTRKPERHQKVERYLTPEGGLTARGELLIENLPLEEQLDVKVKVEQRRQLINPGAQVPESPWPMPEIPASMPEMGGMDQAPMVDPMQTETMVDPMQTEAMWATVWQLTGQAVPGTWGMPSESVEPLIPSYDREAFGEDFQYHYDPHADQYPGRGV
ncbi:MAG: hypothetical protein P8X89_14875 [Reinekea sp.]